jgi:carbon-monoxide dehydrogenase large subunit
MSELHTGIEQTIDILAEKIGKDAVEFRHQNCVKGGDIILTGMTMHPTGLSECIEKAAKAIEWGKDTQPSSPNKFRGKGIALMWKAPSMPPNAGSSAEVKFTEDGTITVSLGGQEIGQGAFTVMAQMAAGVLGIPYESVRVRGPLDTRYSPYEWQTVASRLTWSMGNAVVAAAQDARTQLLDVVADHWDEEADDLDIVDGKIVSYKSENEMSVANVGIYGLPNENDEGWKGGPIVGRGSFMPTYVTNLDFETGQGDRAVVHYTTGAQAFDIEIDKETGRIEVLKAASAFDVGKAINPELVKAQIEGGFIQGYSSAVFEQMILKEGAMLNPSFVDYRIATSVDIPDNHHIDIIEVPQDDGPWGARGIGEHPMVPTIAALGNAIYNATGLRLEGPPFTAEKLYLAMLDAGLIE